MSRSRSNPTSHDVTLLAKREPSEASPGSKAGSEFLARDPEVVHEMYGRLAWTALMYAMVYFAAFGLALVIDGARFYSELRWHDWTITVISIVFGIAVFFACRRRLVPAGSLYNFATAWEILGAIGINAGAWEWESRADLGSTVLGVSWVCVWILVFPTVIPAAPRRTAFAGTVAALSGPAIMLLSVVVNGLPPGATWGEVNHFIVGSSYPAILCAGLAYWTAILVYKLTREASKARQMGSYQLVERIGAGGMGEVWRAKHRLLVRPAVIKLIRLDALGRDEASRRTAIKRFEREAQATAALRSPHTIEIYDFGFTREGTFFYVMELLDGLDLRTLVERHGPIPAERAVHMLRQACHSLYDAHASGMVHRDVKPANIFACRRGQEHDFIKVLDFGLVASNSEASLARTQLTREGVMSGTPGFMAPEMAYGDRAVDPRSDIYALGCVGYWLLTGHLVFEGPTPMSVVIQHVNEPPRPPSARSELSVPVDLERIVLECLAKDPERRPQSSRDLDQRLAACAAAAGAWTEERAADWWRRHLPGAGPAGAAGGTRSHGAE